MLIFVKQYPRLQQAEGPYFDLSNMSFVIRRSLGKITKQTVNLHFEDFHEYLGKLSFITELQEATDMYSDIQEPNLNTLDGLHFGPYGLSFILEDLSSMIEFAASPDVEGYWKLPDFGADMMACLNNLSILVDRFKLEVIPRELYDPACFALLRDILNKMSNNTDRLPVSSPFY